MEFTSRELDIMSALWACGPSTVAEVRDYLAGKGVALAYNTVLTMLRILEEKESVGHVAEGRAFRFHALVAKREAGASALSRTLNRLFEGSAEALVAQLVEERNMSHEELRRLRSIVDEQLNPADVRHQQNHDEYHDERHDTQRHVPRGKGRAKETRRDR